MDVRALYDRHPISEAQVLAAVARRGLGPGRPLAPDDLFDFDQDHYGGVAAVEALARRAHIGPRSRVLDVCCGLAGPARFLAWRFGCPVVGIELNWGRAAGARRLSRLVGLAGRVHVVQGDAVHLPFPAGGFDACVSQEAFLHIEDKTAVLRECRRVLRPGGRLAFTDWVAGPRLEDGERARLREWMAATGLPTLQGYRDLLGRCGFAGPDAEEISDDWRPILRARAQAYRAMRADLVARFGETWYGEYLRLFAFFVELVEAGKLRGGRFSGTA